MGIGKIFELAFSSKHYEEVSAKLEDIQNNNLIVESTVKALLQVKDFKAIFDAIPHIVYISRLDDHRILYVNKCAIKLFGEDYESKKCYEYFQHLDVPCTMCTNNEILERGLYNPYEWTYHNPVTNKDYQIIDILVRYNSSGNVRFEMAIEINTNISTNAESR